MSLFDQLEKELDRAGEAAKQALDEGRLRLDLHRVRRRADEAASALGFAVHRARREGRELDAETLARLDGALAEHTKEAARIEAELASIRTERRAHGWRCWDDRETSEAGAASGTGPEEKPAGTPAS
ncbi:MAG: hypothetical protein KJZ74_06480 [Gemmatimonadales bacterium]|nr:hypothetical protein [Gemmatimonadota bacterium]MCL4213542.1 hypothetical protein [Gemmatimonadales bacterium]